MTHSFDADTIYWPTESGFQLEVGFEGLTEGGYYYASNTYAAADHGGTHLDAPKHFAEGRNAADEVPLRRLLGPACVIDVAAAAAEDPSLLAALQDPIALTPGFSGSDQPNGLQPRFDQVMDSWVAPFIMATINTKNIHRSNLLLGHPYGENFRYDEMLLTGPGDQGEAIAKAVAEDSDYLLSVADIEAWETTHGRIQAGCIVLLNTGYASFWPDREQYMGTALLGEAGVANLHFPGFSEASAIMLADRGVAAVGIDTPSIDRLSRASISLRTKHSRIRECRQSRCVTAIGRIHHCLANEDRKRQRRTATDNRSRAGIKSRRESGATRPRREPRSRRH